MANATVLEHSDSNINIAFYMHKLDKQILALIKFRI
jgi:hypothetical protein